MNVIGCIRVSRVGGRGGDAYISPEVQRERISAWAAARGYTVIAWEVDEDQSGGKMTRPGLDRAIGAIRRREADGLVVAEITRFARTIDGLTTIAEIEAMGGAVFDTEGMIDTTDDIRRGLTALMLGIASKYRVDAGAGWARAQGRAVARGCHVGKAPYGYTRVTPSTPLLVHPERGAQVTAAFEARAAGAQWADVAALVPGLSMAGVRKMIANRVYLGEARGANVVNAGAHPALTDEVTFQRCQTRIDAAVRNGHTKTVGNLPGLLRCGTCLHTMSIVARRGNPHSAYVCRAAGCTARAGITCRLVDAYVDSLVEAAWDNPEHPVAAIRAAGDARGAAGIALEDARAELAAYHTLRGITQEGIDAREAAISAAQIALALAPAGVGPYGNQPNPSEMPAGAFAFDARATYRALIDHVTVAPAGTGPARNAPASARCEVAWRAAA